MAATTTPTKSRLTATERREQLLDVSTELIVERGFHGVSIDAIAKQAGITRAVVYQHFSDLPTLLRAVVARESARALAQVSATALPDLSGGDPRQLMLESLRSFLTAVRDHPTTWRLVMMPPEGAPKLLRVSIEAGRDSVLRNLTEAVRPILTATDDAELTAAVLSAISDKYALLTLTDPEKFTIDRLLAHADWLLDGVMLRSALADADD
jgi:AcrR family transcriptional regulator